MKESAGSVFMGRVAPAAVSAIGAPATAPLRDRRTEVLAELILAYRRCPVSRLLVLGCGSGMEAAVLSAALDAETVGIDVAAAFDPRAAAQVELRRADATQLPFEDGAFDLVF